MKTPQLLITNAKIVTPVARDHAARGLEMSQLRILPDVDIVISEGKISQICRAPHSARSHAPQIDAMGMVVVPGLIDCHTHMCWAGSRVDEWEMKLSGTSYLDILSRGGGIMSTVRAVRKSSAKDLAASLLTRLNQALAAGTTTVEVKTGYGLTTAAELLMLEAISSISQNTEAWPGTLVPTALLGHALDPEVTNFVSHTTRETLDAVHRILPSIAIDVFVEQGAWSLEDARSLLQRAKALGHPIRAHVDQFTSTGGVAMCVELEASSADHLEASSPETLSHLAKSSTIGVGLPMCGLHLDGRYANLRSLIDQGGAAALATNCNPGSAPALSMALAMSAAVRHCGLTCEEALTAATWNAACVLGFRDRGSIEPGMRADLCILNTSDFREIAYWLGVPVTQHVVAHGVRVCSAREPTHA